MNAYETYIEYLALKAHFTRDDYDYFKYSGKVKASLKSFESRKDKRYFEKLAKKKDVRGHILANITNSPTVWIGELVDQNSDDVYMHWKKIQESMTYNFQRELKCLKPKFAENTVVNNDHPFLFKKYLIGDLSLESMTILSKLMNLVDVFDKRMRDDPVWKYQRSRIIKYQPFVDVDVAKMRHILTDVFEELK